MKCRSGRCSDLRKSGVESARQSGTPQRNLPPFGIAQFPTRRFVLVMLSTIFWCFPPPASASEASGVGIQSVQLGFDGQYKLGCWTPVSVTLSNIADATDLEIADLEIAVTAPDNDAVAARVVEKVEPHSIARLDNQEARVVAYTRIGRVSGSVTVELLQRGEVMDRHVIDLRQHPGMPTADFLVVTIGSIPYLADIVDRHPVTRQLNARVVAVNDLDRLPLRWYGYEGVDAVILSGSLTEVQQLQQARHVARLDALTTWLRGGGQVVLSVDDAVDEDGRHLLSEDSPLAELMPGRTVEMINLPPLRALEAYCRSREQLNFEDDVGRPLVIRGPRSVDVEGDIVVFEGREAADFPVLIRSAVGFGEVVFLAIDLARPQFETWNGTENLIAKLLLADGADQSIRDTELPGELAHLGYDDLSAQLRSALDDFSAQGVQLLSFGLFFVLCFFYVLILAPGDYFALKRLSKRMELTWITFPLLVVLSSAAFYYLATKAKGDQLRCNQVSLVDIDLQRSDYRATTWLTLFSPRTDLYDLSLRSRVPDGHPHPRRASNREARLACRGLGCRAGPWAECSRSPHLHRSTWNTRWTPITAEWMLYRFRSGRRRHWWVGCAAGRVQRLNRNCILRRLRQRTCLSAACETPRMSTLLNAPSCISVGCTSWGHSKLAKRRS